MRARVHLRDRLDTRPPRQRRTRASTTETGLFVSPPGARNGRSVTTGAHLGLRTEQPFGLPGIVFVQSRAAAPNGGSVRVLRGSRGHLACCRPLIPMPVDPASTALWPQDRSSGLHGPALPDMDFRDRASSNFSSNIVSESGSTDFVEDLVRLEAQVAGDDFFLDLGGAAEDRHDDRR